MYIMKYIEDATSHTCVYVCVHKYEKSEVNFNVVSILNEEKFQCHTKCKSTANLTIYHEQINKYSVKNNSISHIIKSSGYHGCFPLKTIGKRNSASEEIEL